MKKIRSLTVGAFLIGLYTMLGSTAFALFSPEVRVKDFEFASANLDLVVGSTSNGPFSHEQSLQVNQVLLANNVEHSTDFWVKNVSSHGISFRLRGQLSQGNQDWDLLKKVVQINIVTSADESGWHTLEEWHETGREIPSTLDSQETANLIFAYRLPDSYPTDPDGTGPLQSGDPIGEELQQKVTQGMIFTVSGEVIE